MLLALIGCIVITETLLIFNHLRYGFTYVCVAGIFAAGPLLAGSRCGGERERLSWG